jgi:hypothetical protein
MFDILEQRLFMPRFLLFVIYLFRIVAAGDLPISEELVSELSFDRYGCWMGR